ncbi:peptide deformylase [Kitasatospora aureofaciens]|uniref:peptide deformylase n=1 Tax=Kitasatospora aureofaciens TaxID=1894 RepID=UPI003406DBF6
MIEVRPSQQMQFLGVVQEGEAVLAECARAFDLPTERETAEQVIEKLFTAMERIGQVHPFAKGMGIAAPQIGIGRAAAIVQPAAPDAPAIVLLNPRITDHSDEADEQFEGCLSFSKSRHRPVGLPRLGAGGRPYGIRPCQTARGRTCPVAGGPRRLAGDRELVMAPP